MIDDKDINKLKEVFATKEDLIGFATKEDLKRFATKEDLEGFATKEDLNSLRGEMLSGFDAILSKIDTLLTENAAGAQRFNRHETWIKGMAEHVDYTLPEA